MQRFRTRLFSRRQRSSKPAKDLEEKVEQNISSRLADERRFASDSRQNEGRLCSTECPENAIPECHTHSVTNQELVNMTLHQEQLQQMRLNKENIEKCQEKVKQLLSLLALKEEAEKDLTAKMTQQQKDFEKARLTWLEEKKHVLVRVTEMKSCAEHLYMKYSKLKAKANHDGNQVKVLRSALNTEQTKLKSLKEEHRKEIQALQGVKSGTAVSDLLRTEKLVSLSEEVSQLSSLKSSLLEENQQLRQKLGDAENYSMKVLRTYCNSDSTYRETLKEKQTVIGALQQLEKTNLTLMQRNTVLNDEKRQLELEKQQVQEDKDSVLQKLNTLRDNTQRVRDEYCGLHAKISAFQSLTERQKEEIERLSVELKTSQTKEKLLSHEIEELTAEAAEISLSESGKEDLEYLRVTVAKYKTIEVLRNETIAGLTEKLCQFDSLKKKHEESLDTLSSSLRAAECAASMYSHKLQESNCLNNKLHSDIRRQTFMLEELQTTKKSLNEDMHSKAAEIASLLSQVEQAKAENEHLMQEVQEMKKNQKILMEKHEAMNANMTQLQSFERQAEKLRKESKNSRDREKHLSGLTETLSAKVDELSSLLKAKDTEIDNVKTELQNSRTSILYLNHMIVNLTQRVTNFNILKMDEERTHPRSVLLNGTEEDEMKLATVIQDLEEANDSLKTNNAKLQSEVEGTLADNQRLLQEVCNLRETQKQLAEQNKVLNNQLTALQSLGDLQNQDSKLLHKSFQECQASQLVLQEQIWDLEKQLKEERQKKRKSDLESQRRMFDSFAESSLTIQPEKAQQDQSDTSQEYSRRVTTLDPIEEQRAEACSDVRALEPTDVTLYDIALNQDREQSIWELSPKKQALVNLTEMLNEQIERQHLRNLTFNKKTKNDLPNITYYEKTEKHLQDFTFDEETSDDQTKEYLQNISLDVQAEEHVTAKEPPQDFTFSMKIRTFFLVIMFGWISKWIKRLIQGISLDMQKEERLQDISVDSTNIDHVQDVDLQQLTEGQFCPGLQLTESVQHSYDERTNERLAQFGQEQQTELCVQDSQLLEGCSERQLFAVFLVFKKLLILIYYFLLTLSVLLVLIGLKLNSDEL